ncbi:TIGR03435 family protein [Granulicella mallensis]|uniref:Uncharacterized protein (TIGR03435 family) n=1 Tax=Granulicella mallensis TaxID=940614 RepID=A0A7W7ZN72_9BACT|nr:TIGR03435 family protein [Granulicella mallensis]MBB5062684.1 uncharacterized protein (TIGR03435 family) [Granulicella mallensis]
MRFLCVLQLSLRCFAISFIGFGSRVVHAQQPALAPESGFEVVSIKPTHFTPGCYSMFPSGSPHYVATCITLRELIARAWKVHPDNIQGGSSQALATAYTVSAVTPNGTLWNPENVRPMLRQMLEERFHVSVHSGTKQISGYVLVVAKGGLKLQASKSEINPQAHSAGQPFSNSIRPGYIRGRNIDLNGIAALLSSVEQNTVVDETGIAGTFDIDLHFAKDGDTESSWPSFPIALEEQLGLQLKAQKVTVNTLVVDHTDNEPTPD